MAWFFHIGKDEHRLKSRFFVAFLMFWPLVGARSTYKKGHERMNWLAGLLVVSIIMSLIVALSIWLPVGLMRGWIGRLDDGDEE